MCQTSHHLACSPSSDMAVQLVLTHLLTLGRERVAPPVAISEHALCRDPACLLPTPPPPPRSCSVRPGRAGGAVQDARQDLHRSQQRRSQSPTAQAPACHKIKPGRAGGVLPDAGQGARGAQKLVDQPTALPRGPPPGSAAQAPGGLAAQVQAQEAPSCSVRPSARVHASHPRQLYLSAIASAWGVAADAR